LSRHECSTGIHFKSSSSSIILVCRYNRPASWDRGDPRKRSGSKKTRRPFPFVKHVFADGGYQGNKLAADLATQRVGFEAVKRTGNDGGFKVVRRRWVVERTFSWLRRNRRLMAHYEAIAIIAEGFAKLAMISVMLKRLTQPTRKSAS